MSTRTTNRCVEFLKLVMSLKVKENLVKMIISKLSEFIISWWTLAILKCVLFYGWDTVKSGVKS